MPKAKLLKENIRTAQGGLHFQPQYRLIWKAFSHAASTILISDDYSCTDIQIPQVFEANL